jgi:hypothetical protein
MFFDFINSFEQKKWNSALWWYKHNKQFIERFADSEREFIKKSVEDHKKHNEKLELEYPSLKNQ